jgi:Mg2+ and Co2+ transporter CorA
VIEFSDVTLAYAIQLAVAPVFLLSGIGAILVVMTNRLGRIIDRARVLEDRLNSASQEARAALHADLATFSRRAKLISCAITACTVTLLVCTVIATLFLSAFLPFDASVPVALLFIAAMLAFFFGLLWFLREIYVAT